MIRKTYMNKSRHSQKVNSHQQPLRAFLGFGQHSIKHEETGLTGRQTDRPSDWAFYKWRRQKKNHENKIRKRPELSLLYQELEPSLACNHTVRRRIPYIYLDLIYIVFYFDVRRKTPTATAVSRQCFHSLGE